MRNPAEYAVCHYKEDPHRERILQVGKRRHQVKLLRIVFTCLVILAVAALGFAFLRQGGLFPSTQSASILERVETLAQLETTEFFYQFVFPYDFNLDDRTMLLIEQGSLNLHELPQESQAAYTLSAETGLRKGGKTSFIVLGMRIRAGISLDNTQPRIEALSNNSLRIHLPYPQIQSIVALDIQQPYNYPAAPLDANGLRTVSSFVKKHAASKAIVDGILEESTESLRSFLTELLSSLGISDITIEFSKETVN